jgi:radical SAM protein with 4Fe4S-binding SPASM domain
MDAATAPPPTAAPTALPARLLRHHQPHHDAPPLTQTPGSPITPPAVNRWHQAVSLDPDREGSIFPDGRAYVCSFLFDTDLHFANMIDGQIVVNKDDNEFDLFTRVLTQASCGGCKAPVTCMGGCPAEELVMGSASCASEADIVPVCRFWKANIRTATAPMGT